MSPATTVSIQRLTKRAQFLWVRQGARASRPSVLVEARRRAEAGAMGLGLTATKKIGGAVIRNRARRRLREAARKLLPEVGLAGVDYVLVARQSTPGVTWPALLDDLRNALIRLAADLEGPPRPPKSRKTKRASSTESE